MKNILLPLIDALCSIAWKIFILFNRILFLLSKLLGKALLILWALLSIIWPLHRAAPSLNKFLKKLNSFLRPWIRRLGKRYSKFLDKADKSNFQKRIFVPIILVLLFLAVHPPSHWGPWKLREQGIASYYGYGFYFKRTASGELYFPWDTTAASLTLPLGTVAKVVNKLNGASVYVRINDRGPYAQGRILDLSFAAAVKLGMYHEGVVPVDIYTRD